MVKKFVPAKVVLRDELAVAVYIDLGKSRILVVNVYLKPKTADMKETKKREVLARLTGKVKKLVIELGATDWFWGGDFNMSR